MSRHSWEDSEMIETLRIARLSQVTWPTEIDSLTSRIRGTDPGMDKGRVRAAVNAACNAIAGSPDAFS
jgi:hypothetical protein